MPKRKRPNFIITDYMMINGVKTKIDPAKTDLPERCLLALAYMATGQQYEIVEEESPTNE